MMSPVVMKIWRELMEFARDIMPVNWLVAAVLLIAVPVLPACQYDGPLNQASCTSQDDCVGGAVCTSGYCVVEDNSFYGKVEVVDATAKACQFGSKTITIGGNEPFS